MQSLIVLNQSLIYLSKAFECFVYFVVLSIAEHLAVIVGFIAAVSECLEQAVRNPWLIVLKKSATVHH